MAEAFLQEGVYRSRGAQAGAALLAANDPDAGRCGLGKQAAVVLDLTPKAEELFEALWPEGVADEALTAMRAVMAGWVERQDALDRKRSHFLKDFRRANGFDRSAYTPEQATAHSDGLERVNDELNKIITRAYHAVSETAEREKITFRGAAFLIGVGRVAHVAKLRGFI